MNTTSKMTDWFPGKVKPVRVGDYNASIAASNQKTMRHWNGVFWSRPWWPTTPVGEIERRRTERSIHTNVPWRGLAEQPWIEWKGGECPVEAYGPRVQFVFRDKKPHIFTGFIGTTKEPGQMRWSHLGNDGDIVAYRVLEEGA